MSEIRKGSCMCGAVQIGFTGEPRFVGECVCNSCREAHGATAVPWVGVKAPQFQILEGEAHLRWFQSSEDSERGFCEKCGTRMLFRSSRWPGEMHMTRTCLKDCDELVSTGVGFKEEFPVWSHLAIRKA